MDSRGFKSIQEDLRKSKSMQADSRGFKRIQEDLRESEGIQEDSRGFKRHIYKTEYTVKKKEG